MAGPTAAYPRKIQIAPDSAGSAGSYADLGSQAKVSLSAKLAQIDVTQLNASGQNQRIGGLQDASIKVDCFYDSADTAQGSIMTAVTTRVPVWVKVFLTATTGIKAQCNVESADFDLDPAGANKLSVSLVQCATASSGAGGWTTF